MMRATALAAAALVASLALAGCSDDGDRSEESFCAELGEVRGIDAALASLEPEELAGAVEDLEALSDVAPEEIRSEVEELVAAVAGIVEFVTTATGDPMDAAEEALRSQEARRAQVERAGAALTAYAEETCDVELGSTTTTTTPTVPVAPPSSVTGLD